MSPRTEERGAGHVTSSRSRAKVVSRLYGDGEYFDDIALIEESDLDPIKRGDFIDVRREFTGE
jgi:hypothetical protein|tara:strand:+ start:452 stop:640 length:189 start_codon:yes stop_codon:yes gene_type:complete